MVLKEKLPEGWKWAELQEVSRVFAGSSAPQDKKYFINGNNPFVRVSDLSVYKKTDNLTQVKGYVTDECVKQERLTLAKKGTLIFPKSGAAITTNNRGILGIDDYIVSHLAAIEPIENKILPKWLYYYFLILDMVTYCDNPGYPSLQLSIIKNLPWMYY
ncbi:MAG: restriction endonuclease subunit S [Nanoarchaeota archaeon]